NTPSFLWGLTIVAAGTSLPDAFVSIKASRKGDSSVSVGNVLGSNIFDLLIAVPAGIMVAGSTAVNFSNAVPMMGVLIFATIVLFTFLRTNLELTNREAYGLLVIYAAFVGWLVLESMGVTNYVV
ncbi:MAG: sodium:calcium antiporter, partial [Halobacteria archaeon]|nr:sodium:calcium antiporter [Halobacteria archaeon]